MLISVTSLSSYEYCKRKLYLERVLKLWEPAKEPTILGSIRHHMLDQVNKQEELIVKSILEHHTEAEITEKYSNYFLKLLKKALVDHKPELEKVNLNQLETYKKIKDLVLQESDIRAQNLIEFIRKHKIFGDKLWEKLTPKIVSEYRVESEKLGLKGIIDYIEYYGDIIIPVEMKTGSAPREGAWDTHKIQLAAYLMMLSDKTGTDIKRGHIRYLDIAEDRDIVLNPFLRMKVTELVSKVNVCLSAKVLPEFCDNQNKCKSCGLKEKCYNKELMDELMSKLAS
jgi:CRISPR-associated protein Cas4